MTIVTLCVEATATAVATVLPMASAPVALNVVNAPVLGFDAPMAVEFRPVEDMVAA